MDKIEEFNVICRTLAHTPDAHAEPGVVACLRVLGARDCERKAPKLRLAQLRATARVIERIYRDNDFARFSWELPIKLYPNTRKAIGMISTFAEDPAVLAFGTRRDDSGESWTHWKLLAADGESAEDWNADLSDSGSYNGPGLPFNHSWRVARMNSFHVLLTQYGGLDV